MSVLLLFPISNSNSLSLFSLSTHQMHHALPSCRILLLFFHHPWREPLPIMVALALSSLHSHTHREYGYEYLPASWDSKTSTTFSRRQKKLLYMVQKCLPSRTQPPSLFLSFFFCSHENSCHSLSHMAMTRRTVSAYIRICVCTASLLLQLGVKSWQSCSS